MCPVCKSVPCLSSCELEFVRRLREALRAKAEQAEAQAKRRKWYAKLFEKVGIQE